MTPGLRRGACPSLSTPMQTGDGFLVRLNPADGRLLAGQLAGLARAAAKFGNRTLEITARGSLQIRGLTEASAVELSIAVGGLGIETYPGLPIVINPLAGLDAAELADPRGLAREIRRRVDRSGLASRLGPKVSVTVDGGGAAGLAGIVADVALTAVASGGDPVWLLHVAADSEGVRLGDFDTAGAAAATICILAAVAERGPAARARDLGDAALAALGLSSRATVRPAPARTRPPLGRFALAGGGQARGFCMAYGQIASEALVAFAEASGEREIRLAPGRGLIVLYLDDRADAALVALAQGLGLIARADDARLAIAACVGAPGCASARLSTRELADALVAKRPGLGDSAFRLHISGCGKGCARPPGPSVTLSGAGDGYEISTDGVALDSDLASLLADLVDQHLAGGRPKPS